MGSGLFRGFLALPRVVASRDAGGTAGAWNHLDGHGNEPLMPGLDRSAHATLAGQLAHAAIRNAQLGGRAAHGDVGDIIGGRFRRQLELDGTEGCFRVLSS